MKFNYERFSEDMKVNIFIIMNNDQKKYGIRFFAKQAGVSPATFHRVINGKHADIETIMAISVWMDKSILNYLSVTA